MIKTNSSHWFFAIIIFTVLIIPNSGIVLGDHGSGGGGGGCSGDCTPPTLGIDNAGKQHVKKGFSINDVSFDVSHFKQEIPTQIIKTGKPVTITLQIFENSGPHQLSHVNLMLGLEKQFINGIEIASHPVQIIWEQTIDGNTTIEVKDSENLVSDVDVTHELVDDAFGNKDRVTKINFELVPTQTFDTDIVAVKMWDYSRNSWTSYFYNSITIEDSPVYEITTIEPQVPNWFKTNAGFWAKNQIPDEAFANGIVFLIENEIMYIPNLQKFEVEPLLHFIDLEKGAQHYIDRYYNDEVYRQWFDENFPEYTIEEAVGMPSDLQIPNWVKINAERWANGFITDTEFVNGIKFLIENGIIIL